MHERAMVIQAAALLLLVGSCAPTPAAKAASALNESALRDLELNHPRLTSLERETLHQRKDFYSAQKVYPDGVREYVIEWTAKDHMVDVSWKGGLKGITTAEVRRFPLKH